MKTIAVFDKRGRRAPGVWPFYNWLRYEFNIIYIDDLDRPAQQGILGARAFIPGGVDYVLWGFMPGTALERSKDFLNDMKIPIIVSVGDVWQFVERPNVTQQFWGLEHIKYVLYKQRATSTHDPHLERLRDMMGHGFKAVGATKDRYGTGSETFLQNAEVLMSPWGIDDQKHPRPLKKEKVIDVSHICTVSHGKPHDIRRNQRAKIENLGEIVGTFTKNVYGKQYHDTLHRTKILVVDASGSGLTTQKYLEGAIHGCLLIGEVPYLDPEVFNSNTMVEAEPDELEEKIKYYLDNEKERREIANRLRELVIKHYNLDKAIDPLVEVLK